MIIAQKERNGYRAEFCDIGEGYGGDFDPNDPNDKYLLRFYVSKWDGVAWSDIEDASYCTYLTVDTPADVLSGHLDSLLDAAEDNAHRSRYESLSWMGNE